MLLDFLNANVLQLFKAWHFKHCRFGGYFFYEWRVACLMSTTHAVGDFFFPPLPSATLNNTMESLHLAYAKWDKTLPSVTASTVVLT